MNATQEQIEKLRTLQESYNELANKVAELNGVAKESTSQEILTAVQSAPVIPLTNDQVEAIINHVINS